VKALREVTVKIDRGSSVCVVGRSGCGKSTLLKIAGLILRPDAGTVSVNLVDVTEMRTSQRDDLQKVIGYSFQEPLLLPYLTALENVTVPFIKRTPFDSGEAGARILSDLGLADRLSHFPAKLSVGEKKRVDIARALLRRPECIVADEPLSNLDQKTSDRVMRILTDYKNQGSALLYSAVRESDADGADQVIRLG